MHAYFPATDTCTEYWLSCQCIRSELILTESGTKSTSHLFRCGHIPVTIIPVMIMRISILMCNQNMNCLYIYVCIRSTIQHILKIHASKLTHALNLCYWSRKGEDRPFHVRFRDLKCKLPQRHTPCLIHIITSVIKTEFVLN